MAWRTSKEEFRSEREATWHLFGQIHLEDIWRHRRHIYDTRVVRRMEVTAYIIKLTD